MAWYSLSLYCSDKPGEQAACEAIAQREANNKTDLAYNVKEGVRCSPKPPLVMEHVHLMNDAHVPWTAEPHYHESVVQ